MRAPSTPAPGGHPVEEQAPTAGAIAAALTEAGLAHDVVERVRPTLERIAADAITEAGRRQAEQVERLLATAGRVTESLDLDTVLTAIVDDARSLLRADSGDMLLWDRDRGHLRVVAVSQRLTDLLGFEMTFGEGLSTQAILAQRTIWVDDYASYAHRARALDQFHFGSVICAPLIFRGDAIGALNLHATQGGHRFGPEDGELLAAFASHAAIALDHARRYDNEVRLGRVLAETNAELSRSLAVQQRLAEQVLLDRGPAGIAEVLAEHLERRVAIQDQIHRVIAGASPQGDESWRTLVDGTPASEPFSVAIRVGREVAGHLVLSAERDLAPIDRALVDVAVTGVALEFAKIRATLEVEERLRGEAIGDLLAGTYPSEAAMAARAARLGHDLGRRHELMVVDVWGDGSRRIAGGSSEPLPADGDRWIIPAIRDALAQRAPHSLTVPHAGSIVVLAAEPTRGDRGIRQLSRDLLTSLEATMGPGTVTIALGGSCARPSDYAPAFASAREALDLMLKLRRRGIVIGAEELGPYGLLLQASSRDDLEAYARSTLAPIVDHDRRHAADLLGTLRAYLEEDRVQRRVAARCFIHVNTVVYRVRRIEQLLARSLDEPSTVFDLTLALRILDVLEGAPPSGVNQP